MGFTAGTVGVPMRSIKIRTALEVRNILRIGYALLIMKLHLGKAYLQSICIKCAYALYDQGMTNV